MSEGINQPNTTMPKSNDGDEFLDRSDRTEELAQAQQAGFSNKGGLDQKVEDADVAHGAHSGDDLIDADPTDPRKADPTAPASDGFSATQGDGPNSQSGASAGSGGMGQRT
ncbi:MAG: hypothetical protein JWL66_1461 [Sphingomonadales bacterium]|jgi:hypothetical protein|nr:hypothetical protein [Sphingomonadales bacterium]